MNKLDLEQSRDMMKTLSSVMISNKQKLCEIDGKIGDGDHGNGIERGFRAADDFIEKNTAKDIYELFSGIGMAMMNSMGGASGVIFSAMFLGILRQPKQEFLDSELLFGMCESGLEKIKIAGKAKKGDKTMIDALEPAVEAMKAAKESDDLKTLLECAYEAAKEGVEETKKYPAKFGRAKFLGDRSIGFEDAGAVSVSLIFKTMYEYVKTLEA